MMAATPQDLLLRKEGDEFYKSVDIEIQTNSKVISVDAKRNKVEVETGENVKYDVEYDFLVLASGGRPKTLAIAKDTPNVFLLRTPDDGNTIGMISTQHRICYVTNLPF